MGGLGRVPHLGHLFQFLCVQKIFPKPAPFDTTDCHFFHRIDPLPALVVTIANITIRRYVGWVSQLMKYRFRIFREQARSCLDGHLTNFGKKDNCIVTLPSLRFINSALRFWISSLAKFPTISFRKERRSTYSIIYEKYIISNICCDLPPMEVRIRYYPAIMRLVSPCLSCPACDGGHAVCFILSFQ